MRRLLEIIALGLLIVGALAGSVSGGDPTRVSLSTQVEPAGATRITATVTDAGGRAVRGASVIFRARTAFGWLELAEVPTSAAGTATITLPGEPRYAEVAVQAGPGSGPRAGILLDRIVRRELLRRPGRDVLRTLSPQPGFITPYPVPQMLVLAVILGGIWMTYAYLVSLLIKIRHVR